MTQDPALSQTRPAERLGWVDAARGLAIVFVVIGHAWRGLDGADLIPDQALFARVDRFIYLFHMPVFFILSGLFLPALVKQISLPQALWKQVLRLLYPMLIWTYLFQLSRYLAGGSANTTVTLAEVFVAPLPPVGHMWFLWALFCIQVPLLVLLYGVPHLKNSKGLALGVLGVCIALLGVMPIPDALFVLFYNAFEYAPFVALGWVAATYRPLDTPPLWLICLGMVLFVALGLGLPVMRFVPLVEMALSMGMAVAFLAAVIGLSGRYDQTGALRMLRGLGTISLTIFLAHTLFSATFRAFALKLGLTDMWLHLIIGTLLGLIGPWLLDRLATRFGLRRALGL